MANTVCLPALLTLPYLIDRVQKVSGTFFICFTIHPEILGLKQQILQMPAEFPSISSTLQAKIWKLYLLF